MGKTALLDAFAQSDLDMRGFHILNCPDVTGGNGMGGPNNYPPIAHQFLNQYNAATGNLNGTQPNTTDLSDWPSPVGQALKFFQATATGYQWSAVSGGGGGAGPFSGIINVKDTGLASGDAVGDGVHDDTAAIQGAMNWAGGVGNPAGSGFTVYFPTGVYRTTAILVTPVNKITMLGDSPYASVIRCDLMSLPAGPILSVRTSGILISRLAFDGNVNSATTGTVPVRHGIFGSGCSGVTIDRCYVYNCLGSAILFNFCFDIMVQDCKLFHLGSFGVVLYFCPRSMVRGNLVTDTLEAGIWVVNSQGVTIASNQIQACAPYTYGLGILDSDNSQVTGNLVQQCAVGVQLQTSSTRAQNPTWDAFFSYGYTFTGNTICRNYYGGVQVMNSHGFKVTGNVITDNGQGGSNAATGFTLQPGLIVLPANQGSGYALGDIVTLATGGVYGTGTPAKGIITRVTPSGAIWPSGILMISAGNYSAWPTASVPLTGGIGTGGKVEFSGSKLAAGGSGYSVGQLVRHNLAPTSGAYWNPVRAMVTGVDNAGAVLTYLLMDGGGYLVNTYATLPMIGDAYSSQNGPINGLPGNIVDSGSSTGPGPAAGLDYPDIPDQGTGFSISAGWGLRYSKLFNSGNGTTFNLSTYHTINGGVISGNIISHCSSGCGYLNLGSSGTDRAGYLMVSGNSIFANKTAQALKGGTVVTGGVITLDNNYNINGSIFETSITVSGTPYTSPLNKIL